MQSKLRRVGNLVIFTGIVFSACASYPIKYKLNDRDIISAQNKVALRVQVAGFTEQRELMNERNRQERNKGFRKQVTIPTIRISTAPLLRRFRKC